MQLDKIPIDLNNLDSHVFWLSSGLFSSKVGEVRAIHKVSVVDVVHSNRAIGDKLFTHHPGELSLDWVTDHSLETPHFRCFFYLVLGETFEVIPHRIHEHVLDLTIFIREVEIM